MANNKMNDYGIYCFIPKKLQYLATVKTITHKGYVLKTAYIAHFLNELIAKYTLTGEYIFPVWSKILQELYGKYYARYIEYLIDNNIIILNSNKQVGKSSRKYRLNLDFIKGENIKRWHFYDVFLRKKIDLRRLDTTFTSLRNSTIDKHVREKIVNDLAHISLNCKKASDYINSIRYEISNDSYVKNFISISQIDTKDIYYKFDEYGRFHTNFTTLKKFIRKNFIKIDSDIVDEVDIKNSQPFFLGVLIQEVYNGLQIPDGLQDYIDLVFIHEFYEDFQQKAKIDINDRDRAKKITYKVLFGQNYNTGVNKIFQSIYPEVFDFIVNYKKKNGGYKILSHKLQRMESDFIFNNVVNDIISQYPHIKLFTVHDSIVYPAKYKNEVESIFNYHLKKLKEKR